MSNHEFYEEEIGRINYIYEEEIARLKSKGYDVCVIEAKDTLGHENDYLYMWKEMEDGKSDWIEIGPVYDQNFLYGKSFVIPTDKNGVRIGPHVASLTPIRPLTHPPEQAPPPKGSAAPKDKKLDRLRDDFIYYKANDYRFMLRKKRDTFHLTVYRRSEPKGKEIDLGPYEGLIEKICEELDIDIADIRRLKAKGWNFGSTAAGAVTARRMKDGHRGVAYIGINEGPVAKLLKKYDVKIEKNGDEDEKNKDE
jgi:hypothetical protein